MEMKDLQIAEFSGQRDCWTSLSNQANMIVHLGIRPNNVDYQCGNCVGHYEGVWHVVVFYDV